MAFLGQWLLVIAIVETIFGVLKSKGSYGLNFMFWTCLLVEFGCACVQSVALFIGERGALTIFNPNQVIRLCTSVITVIVDSGLLVAEAVTVGKKLRRSTYFLDGLKRSTIISMILFVLLAAPTTPILITGFWPDYFECFQVPRNILDPLTILVALTPVYCPVVMFVAWKFVTEVRAPKQVAVYTSLVVGYLCYCAPVVGLGVFVVRQTSDCDKHTILVISNIIPAIVTFSSALLLNEARDPSEYRNPATSNPASVHISEYRSLNHQPTPRPVVVADSQV